MASGLRRFSQTNHTPQKDMTITALSNPNKIPIKSLYPMQPHTNPIGL